MPRDPVYLNESDVKRRVKKYLDRHHWFWWMTPANGFGTTGVSDFTALRGGVFLAIETKFGTNKLTAMQRAYLHSVRAEDGFAFVVTEQTIEALRVWLEAFDRAVLAASTKTQPAPEDGAAMLDAIAAMTKDL